MMQPGVLKINRPMPAGDVGADTAAVAADRFRRCHLRHRARMSAHGWIACLRTRSEPMRRLQLSKRTSVNYQAKGQGKAPHIMINTSMLTPMGGASTQAITSRGRGATTDGGAVAHPAMTLQGCPKTLEAADEQNASGCRSPGTNIPW
jgi:hypothetical protein